MTGGRVAPDLSAAPLEELYSLAGDVAVITGAARGIGQQTARRLAEAGAAVAVLDLDAEGAAVAAAEIASEHGVETLGLGIDLRDGDAIVATIDRVEDRLGDVTVLVNNAGVYPASPLLDMTDDEWDHVLDINLRAVFVTSRVVGRRMVEHERGVIVNLASVSGLRSSRGGRGHYVASKHGVVGLTKALATELGPHGVRVLGVAPTTIDTPGLAEQLDTAPASSDWIRQLGASLPLGRGGVPDDVARVVVFCASGMAAMMTGSTLLVDGGQDAVM